MNSWLAKRMRISNLVQHILFSLRNVGDYGNAFPDHFLDLFNDVAGKFFVIDTFADGSDRLRRMGHRYEVNILIIRRERHSSEDTFPGRLRRLDLLSGWFALSEFFPE